ncbi:MAG TPA: hypothetical protein VJQ51_03965 [Burkholderiales bacterium]|nr:hypothetical protein [Burkholderiales bacterium]
MRASTISVLLAVALFAGVAAGADTRDPTPPAKQPTPGDQPANSEFCTRRDISPEDYQKNCVVQNGPPHRHVIGAGRRPLNSGGTAGTR